MEALPSSTGNVVYGGAVPILCQKLLEIHYIDLAEQALSVSSRILIISLCANYARLLKRFQLNIPLRLFVKGG